MQAARGLWVYAHACVKARGTALLRKHIDSSTEAACHSGGSSCLFFKARQTGVVTHTCSTSVVYTVACLPWKACCRRLWLVFHWRLKAYGMFHHTRLGFPLETQGIWHVSPLQGEKKRMLGQQHLIQSLPIA